MAYGSFMCFSVCIKGNKHEQSTRLVVAGRTESRGKVTKLTVSG